MTPYYIEATNIPDAFFQAVYNIFEKGNRYKIQHGSFVGQTRLEYDYITIRIKHPYQEPYDLMLPQMPPHLNVPNPIPNGYTEQYLPYIMTDYVEPGESYSYGSRIYKQIPYWIEVLKKTPNTNQAVLQVASPDDYKLEHPPCWRAANLKIKHNNLMFYVQYRSNDLWSAFCANMAATAVLQKYMADEIGVIPGEIIYSCSGLHLYDYCEELARLRKGEELTKILIQGRN